MFQHLSRDRASETPSTTSSLDRSSTEKEHKIKELELELERVSTRAEHLKSTNEVLDLTLEDSKALTDKLTVLLGKYESNNTAFQLALNYCDHMVESYDVLVALLETESGLLATTNDGSVSNSESNMDYRRARSNRRSAEVVARHLLARMDKTFNRSDSGIGGTVLTGLGSVSSGGSHLDTTWEDSSGYSHTTR